jgi:pimeloyl-ACP methyl ester carboxylesterase
MTAAARTDHLHIGPFRLRARVVGDGPPLLMLMGIGGNLDMWEPLAAELPDRKLIMFDHLGTRGSSGPWLPPTMAHNAWLATRVLHAVGERRADVLGYSWGGLVAQQLAIQHRRSVRRVVLACTTVGWGGQFPSLGVMRRMVTPRRYYSRKYFREVAPDLYGGRFRSDPSLVDRDFGHRMAHPPSALGYAAQLTAAATYSSIPGLPFTSSPTLVLAGDDDPIVPSINPRLLATLLRRGELYVMPGAGHLLLVDRAPEAGRVIDEFLSRRDGD